MLYGVLIKRNPPGLFHSRMETSAPENRSRMNGKILVFITSIIILVSLAFSGCSGSAVTITTTATTTVSAGVSQQDFNNLQKQLAAANHDLTVVQDQLGVSEGEVDSLNAQIAALQAKYEFKGATLAETATRLVANYNAAHVYTAIDYFTCGDMASEVWNMLKARNITAVIVVGNVKNAITDILQSTHAWVLATVDNGEKLALETTAGTVVKKSENALYYRGWIFTSPAVLKANNDLIREYNVRVAFRNLLAEETNAAAAQYNNASSQAEADKYLTLYDKLKELKDGQETLLLQLKARIDGLATVLN
jgi:hypothetical protein